MMSSENLSSFTAPSVLATTITTYFILPATVLYYTYPLMTSILRSIIAGPRVQHVEAGLDLCYVCEDPIIIAMSMPTNEFPKNTYRNPLHQVLKFLDAKHGEHWRIWEFRAEGAGYKDGDVYNRIFHAPFPDHHPPPFALIPATVASMRNHLKGNKEAVAVVHCKAGKGRSGTMSCSYLISEENWTAADAMARFTAARMRPAFGEGVSIPSQRRWVNYVESWVRNHNKTYIERRVEIKEVHVWGLRDSVRVAVQGYADEGKEIKTYHTFKKDERIEMGKEDGNSAVVFKPKLPLVLATNDVNIDFEKRNKAAYGWSIVTSIAHVWFNAFFEGDGKSGMFEIEWDAMDGIKGTLRKGVKGFDKLQVVWSIYEGYEHPIEEPKEGESIPQPRPAETKPIDERDLGLKKADTDSTGSSTSDVRQTLASQDGIVQSPVQDKEISTHDSSTKTGGSKSADSSTSDTIYAQTLPVSHSEEPYITKEHRIGSIKRKKHHTASN